MDREIIESNESVEIEFLKLPDIVKIEDSEIVLNALIVRECQIDPPGLMQSIRQIVGKFRDFDGKLRAYHN